MNHRILTIFLAVFLAACAADSPPSVNSSESHSSSYQQDSLLIRKIYDEALLRGESYENLRSLCKDIGSRLTGSPEAEKAVLWGKKVMEEIGLDTVYLQEMQVPVWIRGKEESAHLLLPAAESKQELRVCALGFSVKTPVAGITAEIVEVHNFEELEELGREKIEGKIVFYNRPMDARLFNTFQAYGGCVSQRSRGASEAAAFGAIATLVRSMTLKKDGHPHTGVMSYDETQAKIPAAAISTEDADLLSESLKQHPNLQVSLKLDCETLEDQISYNVIGEIRGSEFPDSYITVGGHLDSWDKGEGAHDDGAGVVQSMEVLRMMTDLGIKPRHTVRAVLFMNEENGAKGAKKYAEAAAEKGENHIAAIESDRGGFTPRGFSIDADEQTLPQAINMVQAWAKLLNPYGLHDFGQGYAGVDIYPLKDKIPAVILMGYVPDSQRYFDHHHAETDVFEAVNKRELELGGAAMAAMIYLLDNNID